MKRTVLVYLGGKKALSNGADPSLGEDKTRNSNAEQGTIH